ncbi:MAG: SCO6880 family protein, partial [Solirubrobacteraceae bacterium]
HNAQFRVNSAARPTARAMVEQQAASATAQEEARGAALVNFGMLVTTTVLEPDQLPVARAAIANLGPTARINLRPVWASQDSAFAAALPVGLFLPAHLKIPEQIRQSL